MLIRLLLFKRQEELQLLQRQLEEREGELSKLKEEARPRVEGHGRAEGGDRGEWSGVIRGLVMWLLSQPPEENMKVVHSLFAI